MGVINETAVVLLNVSLCSQDDICVAWMEVKGILQVKAEFAIV
jgi:hypothetical protein